MARALDDNGKALSAAFGKRDPYVEGGRDENRGALARKAPDWCLDRDALARDRSWLRQSFDDHDDDLAFHDDSCEVRR